MKKQKKSLKNNFNLTYYFMSKLSILAELWQFLKVRKKWWLTPIVIFLILLGALIVLAKGSALAPFIYAIF